MLVSGKDNIEVAFFIVPPVNQIKEQTGILFVELTVAYFVNNQAGRPLQTIENGCFLASLTNSIDEKSSYGI